MWDPQEAGEFLVAQNFTFFFNIDSNGTYAIWLRSIIPFREELGLSSPNRPYRDILTPSARLSLLPTFCCFLQSLLNLQARAERPPPLLLPLSRPQVLQWKGRGWAESKRSSIF